MSESLLRLACALPLVVGGCSDPGVIVQSGTDGGDPIVTGDGKPPATDSGPHDGTADAAGDGATPDGRPGGTSSSPASVTYPEGTRHSPIDSAIAAHLQSIINGNAHELAKVGDSITASTSFFTCFDGGSVDLAGRSDLADTINYFLAGTVGGSSPFARTSKAAIGGDTTRDILSGSPSPLSQEIAALDPRYAVIMLGTNDIRYGRSYDDFGADLWTIVDQTLASGAIPILSTIPPADDSDTDARIPTANRIVRAIAQGRQIPLVDFHREMLTLPSRGISSDGIHPTVSPSGACQLNSTGLQYGYNVRNLISLEALGRARTAASGTALDGTVGRPAGSGTAADPYVVPSTFVDLNDNRDRAAKLTTYAGESRSESGGEAIYRISLWSARTLDVLVVDRGSTDVDVHILQGALTGSACVAGADHQVSATVSGTVYIVVDSPNSGSEGEYLLVVQAR